MYLRIKDILTERKSSIKNLAEKIGISRENLTNIVNERSKPSFETLIKVSKALNVPISELFQDSTSATLICPHCGKKIKISLG